MTTKTFLLNSTLASAVLLAPLTVTSMAQAEGLYGEIGVNYLKKDGEDDFILTVLENNRDTILSSSDQVLMDSEDMDVDWDVGGEVTVGYAWDDVNAIEVAYSFVGHDGDASVTSSTNSLAPSFYFGTHFGIEDFLDAYRHDVSYDSDLSDIQLNYRRKFGDRFTGILGLRYIQLDEDFTFIGTKTALPGSAQGLYENNTENSLIGVHFGGDYVWPFANNGWSVKVAATGGAYYNDGNINSTIEWETVPPPDRPNDEGFFDSGTSSFSGSFDGSIGLNWDVTQSVSLSAGYEMLFLSGLALVSENYMEVENDGPTFFSTKASSTTLYHGAFLKARVNF